MSAMEEEEEEEEVPSPPKSEGPAVRSSEPSPQAEEVQTATVTTIDLPAAPTVQATPTAVSVQAPQPAPSGVSSIPPVTPVSSPSVPLLANSCAQVAPPVRVAGLDAQSNAQALLHARLQAQLQAKTQPLQPPASNVLQTAVSPSTVGTTTAQLLQQRLHPASLHHVLLQQHQQQLMQLQQQQPAFLFPGFPASPLLPTMISPISSLSALPPLVSIEDPMSTLWPGSIPSNSLSSPAPDSAVVTPPSALPFSLLQVQTPPELKQGQLIQ
jgi:hypothetical protein